MRELFSVKSEWLAVTASADALHCTTTAHPYKRKNYALPHITG